MERTKEAPAVRGRTANDPLGKGRRKPASNFHPPKGNKIWWIKRGGGTFTLNGKKIKPNEKFQATVSEIPKAFRDTILPINPVADEVMEAAAEAAPIEVDELEFTIQEEPPESGIFIVINGQGKIVSDGDLTEDEALELVKKLKG